MKSKTRHKKSLFIQRKRINRWKKTTKNVLLDSIVRVAALRHDSISFFRLGSPCVCVSYDKPYTADVLDK